MHSQSDTLVRMANQIGKFFAVQGEDRAVAGIADHIKKFWEPRMKKQIFAYLDEGGSGLDPLTLKGLQSLKSAMHGQSTMAEANAAAAADQVAQTKQVPQVPQVAQQPKAKARANGNGGASGKGKAQPR